MACGRWLVSDKILSWSSTDTVLTFEPNLVQKSESNLMSSVLDFSSGEIRHQRFLNKSILPF